MTTLRLHHCHEARSMRSLWLLHELGQPFELVVHDFGPALRDPDYLAIHPLGRVPALEIGETVLFESGAICEYLCERFAPAPPLWRAPGDPERPAWLNWLHYAETIGQHLAALTQQHIAIRDDADRSPLVMKLETRRLEKALGVVEDALSDGRAHLLPQGFSAVDTGIGYAVHTARHFTPLEPFPALAAYHRRLSERPGFRKALPPAGAPRLYARDYHLP